MSSIEPNRDNQQNRSSFSLCDKVAAFYETLNVPGTKTVGAFGGKSFTWFIREKGKDESFQVNCTCNVLTLGLGMLSIESRMASSYPSIRLFSAITVNDGSPTINLKGALGYSSHEIRIPCPYVYTNPKKTLE